MYYITHYNRNGVKYTSQKVNRPRLLPYTPCLQEQEIYNLNTPVLTEQDKTYTTFQIPKASGGCRTIEAPSENLKIKQRKLLNLLKDNYKLLESPWAYAYIKNTCALDALKEHQKAYPAINNEFAKYLSTVAMMITESTFSKDNVEKEIPVVQQEIARQKDKYKTISAWAVDYLTFGNPEFKNTPKLCSKILQGRARSHIFPLPFQRLHI